MYRPILYSKNKYGVEIKMLVAPNKYCDIRELESNHIVHIMAKWQEKLRNLSDLAKWCKNPHIEKMIATLINAIEKCDIFLSEEECR